MELDHAPRDVFASTRFLVISYDVMYVLLELVILTEEVEVDAEAREERPAAQVQGKEWTRCLPLEERMCQLAYRCLQAAQRIRQTEVVRAVGIVLFVLFVLVVLVGQVGGRALLSLKGL